jgi:hypothetical protein
MSYYLGYKITIKKALEEENAKKSVKKGRFCYLCFAISSFFVNFAPVFKNKSA